ncbi:DNA topology modulation protein [Gorillibacterium timonense]|uniref:DNA topology modulation protein n=1 Tax=Gorillibacterium timonense TaxID=1689269 RepID=UPI00071DE6BD|nr:DNA topology modulation protein [Gorillibacterium timonense]
MKRVLVLGCSGSGKSTFSVQLGERTDLPVIHLDSLYWKPGWIASQEKEWDEIINQLLLKDNYILDGNYTKTIQKRLKEVDTVFYFDFSRYLCLYRVVKRRILNHGKTRRDMTEGCIEKIDFEFIKWIWNYKKRNRPKIIKTLEEVKDDKEIIIFRTRKEVREYLLSL